MRPRVEDGPDPLERGGSTSPPWADALVRVRAAVVSTAANREGCVQAALDNATSGSARAHGRLLRAVEGRRTAGEDAVGGLVDDASELLRCVSEVLRLRRDGADQRAGVVEALARCLRGHEGDVLAGELTYEIASRDAQAPAAQTRKALALLRASDRGGHADLLSLQVAVVDLVALLVRAAGNLATANSASGVSVDRAAMHGVPLRAIALEVGARAEKLRRRPDEVDGGARPLCAALRVSVSVPAPGVTAGCGRSQMLRGEADGLARAQLIVLTRLVRAAAAIAIVDTVAAASAAQNGRSARGGREG